MLDRPSDGSEGRLAGSKLVAPANCSSDTALHDIASWRNSAHRIAQELVAAVAATSQGRAAPDGEAPCRARERWTGYAVQWHRLPIYAYARARKAALRRVPAVLAVARAPQEEYKSSCDFPGWQMESLNINKLREMSEFDV